MFRVQEGKVLWGDLPAGGLGEAQEEVQEQGGEEEAGEEREIIGGN